MKQFLILALLTLAVLGGFYLVRDSEPADAPGASTAARGGRRAAPATAPTTRRPNVPRDRREGGTVQTKQGQAVTVLGEETAARLEAQREFDWDALATADAIVRMEDAWQVDLTGIDWDADVLCRVNGQDITQERFRRQVVLDLGYVLVRAAYFSFAGQRVAAEHGMPYGLTDEQFDAYITEWGRWKGMTREETEAYFELTTKLPAEAALHARRQMLESILAFFPHVDEISSLPVELLAVLRNDGIRADAMSVISAMAETRDKLDTEQGIRDFVQIVEPMTHMWSLGVGSQEVFRRSWTFLDAALPEDAVAGYFTGVLDETDIQPPWTLVGEFRYVETEPLWQLIEPALTPFSREGHLRRVIWSSALRAELASAGALPTPEKAWKEYALEYLKGQNALLGTDFIALAIKEYPTLAHYREVQTLMAGFLRTREPGWDSEDRLREFFERNRMFVQPWAPDLDVAVFPPKDLSKPLAGDPDWEYGRQRAQEFYDRVMAGEDFTEACVAHNQQLAKQIEKALGPREAADFRIRIGGGHLKGGLNELHEAFRESRYKQMLNCTSVVRNAVARLRADEISEPWRSEIGYLVLRMNRVRLAGLEDEFEDLVDQTRTVYHDSQFLKWANDAIRNAEVVVPG